MTAVKGVYIIHTDYTTRTIRRYLHLFLPNYRLSPAYFHQLLHTFNNLFNDYNTDGV